MGSSAKNVRKRHVRKINAALRLRNSNVSNANAKNVNKRHARKSNAAMRLRKNTALWKAKLQAEKDKRDAEDAAEAERKRRAAKAKPVRNDGFFWDDPNYDAKNKRADDRLKQRLQNKKVQPNLLTAGLPSRAKRGRRKVGRRTPDGYRVAPRIRKSRLSQGFGGG